MNQNVGLGSISYIPNNNILNTSNGLTSYPITNTSKFGPRALRSETRAKAKDEIKKVKNTIQVVKKWEKRLVALKDSSLKVYKWVPITSNLPVIDHTSQRDVFNSNSWKKFNSSRKIDSLNISTKFDSSEMSQIDRTMVNENLYKFSTQSISNKRVLNHDENAQDSLLGCDRSIGKINKNQNFSPNNENLVNDNNSSSSSLTFCSNQLHGGMASVNLIDLNNNSTQIVSSDAESSNQNSNDNDNNLSQCETFTQIETINNSKIPLKQNGPIESMKDMPLTAYYECFFK